MNMIYQTHQLSVFGVCTLVTVVGNDYDNHPICIGIDLITKKLQPILLF